MQLFITDKKIGLLECMLKNGRITISMQKTYSNLAFRINMSYFIGKGLVVIDGVKGRQRAYRLTKDGEMVASHLISVRNIMQSIEDGYTANKINDGVD